MALTNGQRSLSATINVPVLDIEKPVMSVNAALNLDTGSLQLSTRIIDKTLMIEDLADIIKAQYDEFMIEVSELAKQHGFVYL